MSKQIRGSLLLLLTAFIWGTAFVAQKDSMAYVGPFTFNGVRMILASLALLAVAWAMRRGGGRKPAGAERRPTLLGGVLCGGLLFVASSLQQFGVQHTTAGKAGFITALYIVLVPVLGLFVKRRLSLRVWLSVGVALAGLYLLSIRGDFTMGRGDFLVTLCALCFALHIMVIDHFSPRADGVVMSCIQFFVCCALSLTAMALFESPSRAALEAAWLPIAYAGLLSGGMGYTLQILAQRHTPPALASLIMSLESVFAVLAGGVLLGERLGGREILGCLLMLGAIVFAQLPARAKSRNPAA